VESSCECGNEPSDSIKCWEIIECLHTGGLSSSAQLYEYSQLEDRKEGDHLENLHVDRRAANTYCMGVILLTCFRMWFEFGNEH
jgi:hypothetical protein